MKKLVALMPTKGKTAEQLQEDAKHIRRDNRLLKPKQRVESKIVNWEDGTYRLVFGNAEAPSLPTEVFKAEGEREEPVDGRLWATILFEGIPALRYKKQPSELSAIDAQAEVEAYRYFFDAEDFPRTPEDWKSLEDFVKKHPASLREWYIEEEGMEPESLEPEFLISWLHDLAELA